jgi:arylsulfatase B
MPKFIRANRLLPAALVLFAVGLLTISCGGPAPESAESNAAGKPNIVILLADDLGFNDVGFHSGNIPTPNIDRIAREGVELNRFYVAPVCSPTRAGLMTGRYPIRFGLMRAVIPPWRDFGLDTSEVTLPEVLAKAGYEHRAIFGKWHLGHSSIKYHPLRRGFTEFVGHYNGAIDFFTHAREGELDWHDGYEASHEQGYSTDLIAGHATRFIRAHAGENEPFLLYVPFNAVHSPFQAKPEDLSAYENLAPVGGRPEPGQTAELLANRRILGAMNEALDQAVGQILDTLDESGIADNTLVWFFSDNGGVGGVGDNAPLRGQKASVWEGGIRVASAVRWPKGGIAGGRKTGAPLANVDILPTLMSAAGVAEHGGKPLDGIDALYILRGTAEAMERDVYSFIGQQSEDDEQVAVIEPEWKLVVRGAPVAGPKAAPEKSQKFLFRIADDPNEENDFAAQHPEVVERLMRKAIEFRSLQPLNPVPVYSQGREGFKAPPEWAIPGR